MDETKAMVPRVEAAPSDGDRPAPLPLVTHAERAFWRRAVEAERARQRCGRPAPFPFQPA
jgi:hypothetical protein